VYRVPATNDEAANGTALIAMVDSLEALSDPSVIELDAGVYDLGSGSLTFDSNKIVLRGADRDATFITSSIPSNSGAAGTVDVTFGATAVLEDLTIDNTASSVDSATVLNIGETKLLRCHIRNSATVDRYAVVNISLLDAVDCEFDSNGDDSDWTGLFEASGLSGGQTLLRNCLIWDRGWITFPTKAIEYDASGGRLRLIGCRLSAQTAIGPATTPQDSLNWLIVTDSRIEQGDIDLRSPSFADPSQPRSIFVRTTFAEVGFRENLGDTDFVHCNAGPNPISDTQSPVSPSYTP
jgi:hypothetical protein